MLTCATIRYPIDLRPETDVALLAFIPARTWGTSQRLLEAQPDLLSDEADALLAALAATQPGDGARAVIERHRALLARCRAASTLCSSLVQPRERQ